MQSSTHCFTDNAEGEVPGIIGNDTSPHLIMPDMSSYFPCISGEIISILGRCDGRIDCFYGDDEMNCDDSGNYLNYIIYKYTFSNLINNRTNARPTLFSFLK